MKRWGPNGHLGVKLYVIGQAYIQGCVVFSAGGEDMSLCFLFLYCCDDYGRALEGYCQLCLSVSYVNCVWQDDI